MASKQNFEIRQGETWTLGMTILGKDGVTPYDLSGATITGAVREHPGTAKIATINCTIDNAIAGEIILSLDDETTKTIPASNTYAKSRTYYYDVKLERTDGIGMYLLNGTINIWGGVQID